MISFCVCLSVCVVLALLLAWNLALVLRGETSLETELWTQLVNAAFSPRARSALGKPRKWDLGRRKNLEKVLGYGRHPNRWWMWGLPTLQPPVGDGCNYETPADVVAL